MSGDFLEKIRGRGLFHTKLVWIFVQFGFVWNLRMVFSHQMIWNWSSILFLP